MKAKSSKLLVSNKSARQNYSIEKTFEAGLILQGWEVKSLRNSNASLENAFIKNLNGEIFLVGATIKKWKSGFQKEKVDEQRSRKLLLQKDQIRKISSAIKEAGFTVIPTKIYLAKHLIKIEIAIAKGLKNKDKRRRLKEKEQKRRVNQERMYYNI